jgi:hypothetical protein
MPPQKRHDLDERRFQRDQPLASGAGTGQSGA